MLFLFFYLEKKVKKIDEKLNHEEKLQKKHEEEFIRPIKIIFESQPNFDSINDTNNIGNYPFFYFTKSYYIKYFTNYDNLKKYNFTKKGKDYR